MPKSYIKQKIKIDSNSCKAQKVLKKLIVNFNN